VPLTLRRSRSRFPDEAESSTSLADEILDEILPEAIEWRQLVWNYPKSTLALAALGGYWLGRSRGRRLLAAAAEYVNDSVTEGVNEFVGREVL
jgi:hypothetical protein